MCAIWIVISHVVNYCHSVECGLWSWLFSHLWELYLWNCLQLVLIFQYAELRQFHIYNSMTVWVVFIVLPTCELNITNPHLEVFARAHLYFYKPFMDSWGGNIIFSLHYRLQGWVIMEEVDGLSHILDFVKGNSLWSHQPSDLQSAGCQHDCIGLWNYFIQ
jgi:hypothetical protein